MSHSEDTAHPSRVGFDASDLDYPLFHVPEFPIDALTRLSGVFDPPSQPWVVLGLLPNIKAAGRFLNPITVWNHGKENNSVRSGRNRVWCAKQLGWTSVPVIVSGSPPEGNLGYTQIEDLSTLAGYFPHNDVRLWSNDIGWGVHVRLVGPELYPCESL